MLRLQRSTNYPVLLLLALLASFTPKFTNFTICLSNK